MFSIESYLERLIAALKGRFGERLLYVGLQGSYLRGEAHPGSDIDVMVVVEELSVPDLNTYRTAIESLECFDKSCGFICGRNDLANWNPLEIHHLLNSTKDYFGSLRELVPPFDRNDIRNFVKISLNNLYHEICHRYIHADSGRNIAELPGSYKSVFFILQNLYYLNHSMHVATKSDLIPLLDGRDRAVLERSIELNNGIPYDFADSFSLLFSWCRDSLQRI